VDTIQFYADMKDFKSVNDIALKAVYGPTSFGSFPPQYSWNHTERRQLRKSLRELGVALPVCPRSSTINDEDIARQLQVPGNDTLADPPSIEEVANAIKCLSSGKHLVQES